MATSRPARSRRASVTGRPRSMLSTALMRQGTVPTPPMTMEISEKTFPATTPVTAAEARAKSQVARSVSLT